MHLPHDWKVLGSNSTGSYVILELQIFEVIIQIIQILIVEASPSLVFKAYAKTSFETLFRKFSNKFYAPLLGLPRKSDKYSPDK